MSHVLLLLGLQFLTAWVLFFAALDTISDRYYNILLAQLISDMREHGNIFSTESNRETNEHSGDQIRSPVAHEPAA